MKKILRKLALYISRRGKFKNYTPVKGKFSHEGIPFFAQWESPELIRDIIERKLKAGNDPRWSESGANSQEEYELWGRNVCGMACLKMILATKGRKARLIDLAKKCTEYGGYQIRGEKIDGLYYQPFIEFINREFDLQGSVYPFMEINDIITELDQGHFAIASVSPGIRYPQSIPAKKGGHLVLVIGYNISLRKLLIHNPSGFYGESQEYVSISFENFEKFFAQKGIAVW